MSVHIYMCVYKVPAANDSQVFLYGVLKSATLGVLLGEGSGEFLHKKKQWLFLLSFLRLALGHALVKKAIVGVCSSMV